MTSSFGDKCLFFVFCVAVFFSFFPVLRNIKNLGATDGQDRGATWLQHHTPFALDRNAFSIALFLSSSFFFVCLTLFLPSVCVFDFVFNLV